MAQTAEPRLALVVGASRGLGLGLAAELRRRGWDVVATARDVAGERRLRALAEQPGGALRVEPVDINDDAGVAALRRRLDTRVFDLVFVNAGIAPPERHDAASAGRDEAALVFLTNAVAPIRLARAFLDRVRDGPGIVAFMSSGLGSVAGETGAQHADRDRDLAARGPGQKLAQRDDVGEGRLVEPFAPCDELAAVIAEMCDRAAERGQAEPQEDAQNLTR
jgi:NAD(P)-dependent dehydrogenase (short-subunit alcohol dehydrogenase family)